MYRTLQSLKWLILLLASSLPYAVDAQSVTSIITDLNGFWKSSTSNINPVKPNRSHNLLSFSYNGIQYSTGVNNELLSSSGENFIACDFWSLPVASISGTINGNTKVGLGALYDGVANGPSNPPPQNNIPFYLTDGTKGLNIGTCIANLPAGTMDFFARNIDANAIGDGIPDILVTQVADPSSGSFDRYEFIDNNETRVGSYKDIVFTSIAPVGTWTADFYEASQNPMTLSAGFTQTDRPIRLWAADLSEFGITAGNLGSISKFRINLCGNSDVAFVAYNSQSFRVTMVLPLTITSFKGALVNNKPSLSWQIQSQSKDFQLQIERSSDGNLFERINTVTVTSIMPSHFSFIDNTTVSGSYYYRLKWIDKDGRPQYSSIVHLNTSTQKGIKVIKSGSSHITIKHPALANAYLAMHHTSGIKVRETNVASRAIETTVSTINFSPGIYIIVLNSGEQKLTSQIYID